MMTPTKRVIISATGQLIQKKDMLHLIMNLQMKNWVITIGHK